MHSGTGMKRVRLGLSLRKWKLSSGVSGRLSIGSYDGLYIVEFGY